MKDNIIDFKQYLHNQQQLLQTIKEMCGQDVAAFYQLKSHIPALKNITWEQVQTVQYKEKMKKR